MGFVRYKSTGDILMARNGISANRFAYDEIERDPALLRTNFEAPEESVRGSYCWEEYNEFNLKPLLESSRKSLASQLISNLNDLQPEEFPNCKSAINFNDHDDKKGLSNNRSFLGSGKWASCKLAGSYREDQLFARDRTSSSGRAREVEVEEEEVEKKDNNNNNNSRRVICKSAGDFFSSEVTGGGQKLQHEQWAGASEQPMGEASERARECHAQAIGDKGRLGHELELELGQESYEPRRRGGGSQARAARMRVSRRNEKARRRLSSTSRPNGARRAPPRDSAELSLSSPVLWAEKGREWAEADVEQVPLGVGQPARRDAAIVVVEMATPTGEPASGGLQSARQSQQSQTQLQQGQHQQRKERSGVVVVDVVPDDGGDEELDSFKSARSHLEASDNGRGDIGGVGGKFCALEKARREQSTVADGETNLKPARPLVSKQSSFELQNEEEAAAERVPFEREASGEKTRINSKRREIVIELGAPEKQETPEVSNGQLSGHQGQRRAGTSGESAHRKSTLSSATNANQATLSMVDFNSMAANKLRDWRQALRAAPSSSGFYKVARPREPSRLGVVSSLLAMSHAGSNRAQVATGGADSDADEAGRRKRVSRFNRPGRSPVSIQRQTNARLVKHRQRIQEQRQQQLAQLASRSLPERSSIRSQDSYQAHSSARQEGPIANNHQQPQRVQFSRAKQEESSSERAYEALHRVNGFLGRLTHPKSCSREDETVAQETTSRIEIEAVRPTRQAICDNQQACSSSNSGSQRALYGNSFQRHSLRAVQRQQQHIDVIPRYNRANSLNMSPPPPINYNIQDDLITQDELTTATSPEDGHGDDDKTISSLAGSTYSLNRPFCKICHVGSSKPGDKLISPCRCSGTMQYIHCGCLLKWLKISNRTNEKPISCELCAHEYTWHKKFNYKQIRMPRLSLKDLFLHLIFILALGVMLFSAITPMLSNNKPTTILNSSPSSSATNQPVPIKASGSSNGDQVSGTASYRLSSAAIASNSVDMRIDYGFGGISKGRPGKLANEERLMLICAASFFISFFLAIYSQTKTRDTLYGFIVKFVNMNQTFYITEYNHHAANGNNNGNNNNNNSKSGRSQVQPNGKS